MKSSEEKMVEGEREHKAKKKTSVMSSSWQPPPPQGRWQRFRLGPAAVSAAAAVEPGRRRRAGRPAATAIPAAAINVCSGAGFRLFFSACLRRASSSCSCSCFSAGRSMGRSSAAAIRRVQSAGERETESETERRRRKALKTQQSTMARLSEETKKTQPRRRNLSSSLFQNTSTLSRPPPSPRPRSERPSGPEASTEWTPPT